MTPVPDLAQLVSTHFKTAEMASGLRHDWHKVAHEMGDEFLDAYSQFVEYKWWEVPDLVLFSGFAGLGFLPDSVFSYYLPRCMLRSFEADPGLEPINCTLYRAAAPGYRLDGLEPGQVLTFGWFLVQVSTSIDYDNDGSLSISKQKVLSAVSRQCADAETAQIIPFLK